MKTGSKSAKNLERKTNKNIKLHVITLIVCISTLTLAMVGVIAYIAFFTGSDDPSPVSDLGLATNGVYVADKANVLNDNVKQKVYNLNKKLEKSDYHAQIMVVVVPSIPSKYSTINAYSMAIAEKYKPGDKDQDTGLLYTVAISDHKARLDVGHGLEGKIPDATVAKLQQPANAHYKKHEYSAGVAALLDGVQQVLLDNKTIDKISIAPSHETDKNSVTGWLLNKNIGTGWLIFLLVFICGVIALLIKYLDPYAKEYEKREFYSLFFIV